MKKICHVFGYGPDKLGGIENYILKMQSYCSSRNIDINFVFTREPIDEFKQLFKEINGKYHVINHSKNIISPNFIVKLYKYLKKGDYDIIHSHFDSANLNVAIATKLINHEMVFWHQRNVFGVKLYKIRNIVYRYLSRHVKNIIAVSKAVENDLIQRDIDSEKVITCYNGIDIEKMKSTNDKKYITKELNIMPSKKLILTVAQARPEKDLQTLIKSIPYIENNEEYHFIIVGGGPLIPNLVDLAKELNINNISFLEKRNDIKDIMNQSDIFVLPSKKEGLGNVILEAIVNDMLVIGTDVGGIPEIIQDGNTGFLFESGNYTELASLIGYVDNLNNKEKEKIKSNAYKYVIDNFDLNNTVKNTIEEIYSISREEVQYE